MSEQNITAAAVDGAAVATEGVEHPHAAVSSQMIAGEQQTCAQCASFEKDLALASEAHEALTQAMTQMRNDSAVSTELANQRELQLFQSKAETDSAMLQLQGDYEILLIKVEQSENACNN